MFYPNAGLASTLNYISGLLSMSFTRGKAMVLSHMVQWCYTDGDVCPGQDLNCYLQPSTNCTDARSHQHRVFDGDETSVQLSDVSPTSVPYDFDSHFYRRPPEFQSLGVFWWRVGILKYLLRLNDKTKADIDLEGVKARIGFKKPILGLHFRKGDSCHTSWRKGKCVGVDEHLHELAAMADRYNIRRVFVATDDLDLPDRLPQLAQDMNLTFVTFNEFDRSDLSSSTNWIEKRLEGGELPRTALAHFTLIDLLLLADTDAMIGHFQSNLSRMALALSASLKRRVPPYVSIDGPWCYQWRMCCHMRKGGATTIC